MAQLRQDYEQFKARNAEILVVNPEGLEQVRSFAQSQGLTFPMLVDPDHEVANRFGQEVNLLKLGRMPALVLLDRAGVIRHEHRGGSMMDTPKNSDVLAMLDRLNAEASPPVAEADRLKR